MRILVALGRSALTPGGTHLGARELHEAVARAAAPLAVIATEHSLVATHGTAPAVGFRARMGGRRHGPRRGDVERRIGYLLEQEITNRLPWGRQVVTVLTRAVVDRADPAFDRPATFVGPSYDDATALRLGVEHGWVFTRDGARLRRVVASPSPVAVMPLTPVDLLLRTGHVVLCAGGGGVPLVSNGGLSSAVDALVDPDAVSAQLATQLSADVLVLATDVDGVYEDWGGAGQRRLEMLDVAGRPPGTFPASSIGPKVEAAAYFARGGRLSVIGCLADLPDLVAGRAGTRVVDTSTRRLTAI